MDDNDHDDSVMIALLPVVSDWCHIELPHLTLVFCGKKSFYDAHPGAYNDMCKDAMTIAMLSRRITLQVTGREQFGNWGDGEVDVYRLRPNSELLAMRNIVEQWNQSEYREFKPHVTIGNPGVLVQNPPQYIAFDRIMVAWGRNQDMTFWLKP